MVDPIVNSRVGQCFGCKTTSAKLNKMFYFNKPVWVCDVCQYKVRKWAHDLKSYGVRK